jgi:triphosphoribosyl-dephospho-CoA synthase
MNYDVNDEAFEIGSIAARAILYEAACFPSPGLVSPVSDGAHDDMNFYTFIDSTSALLKSLILCANKGLSEKQPQDIFKSIRKIGAAAEKDMYKNTGGVNTHKGMIFLMCISCAAAARTCKMHGVVQDIRKTIMDMTRGIVERELETLVNKDKSALSHGEKIYLKYGIEGVRGEVERGMPTIFDFSLEFYKGCSSLSKNDRLIHTLIGIMQYSEDSNILYRHSIDVLKEVQEKAKYIMSAGGMLTDKGRNAIKLLDEEFSSRRISPGGSADLLAVTVFFSLIEDYLKGKEDQYAGIIKPT